MAEAEASSMDSAISSAANTFESDGNTSHRLNSVLLNEYNYLRWSRAVSLALGGKSKIGYINGTITTPAPLTDGCEAWSSTNQLVMTWLLNSMEPQISEIFQYSESALDLWKALKEMYGNQNNAARVFQLKKEISDIQQDEKTFVKHLGTFTTLWNELNLYRPHSTPLTQLSSLGELKKIRFFHY